MNSPRRNKFSGIFLALLTASTLVAEGPPEVGETVLESPPVQESPAVTGLRVYLDPETGEVTSTPSRSQVEALSKALEGSLSRSTEGLEPFELPRGGRGVFLNRRFQTAFVVRIDADGNHGQVCVDDPEHLLLPIAPKRPPQEEWPEK